MNQIKIGKFIASCRKAVGLTQLQLAEKLDITDKAVSKWERGIALPDTAIMLPLCDILGISVNELLSGERIDMEQNPQQNQQLLLELSKDLEQKNKTIWTAMWLIMSMSIVFLITGLLLSALVIHKGPWQLVGILGSVLCFLPSCFYALKLEVSVGAYKCKECGQEIIPTYKEALNAQHMGTTRRLKCPNCNKRTWCKKVLQK